MTRNDLETIEKRLIAIHDDFLEMAIPELVGSGNKRQISAAVKASSIIGDAKKQIQHIKRNWYPA